ncbi:sepiapterin reductase-like [Diachasmimorpha longicaudata]|uniref:sepiapterin reductase-like n=1 Tax=Diachasmimorpha longicaudata TaxID=58733 RepID=UPI0030B8A57C
MAVELLSGKTFLLITGASQGIGRQIAVTVSRLLEKGSKLLLLARSENGLKDTADQVSKEVFVDFKSVDLSVATADQLSEIIRKSIDPSQFDRVMAVHNVGSVGELSKFTADMTDFDEWRKYYDLNVFSPAVLNSVVMNLFGDNEGVKKVVVNVTSICSIRPMKSMGYYCSGKAAREMYFKVFAEENPNVHVLSYSPGPVETNMLKTVAESAGDEELRTSFIDMRNQNKQLTTEQTVNRFVEILRGQKYKSGAHVDYYDDI